MFTHGSILTDFFNVIAGSFICSFLSILLLEDVERPLMSSESFSRADILSNFKDALLAIYSFEVPASADI